MKTFLVEHYWPGVTVEVFSAAAGRVHASAQELARNGSPIRYLHATFVPEDEAAFCVFDAESADLIDLAYLHAGVRYERLVAALEVGPTGRLAPADGDRRPGQPGGQTLGER